MSYRIINWPHFVERSKYDKAIDTMLNRLSGTEGIKSVYGIGSVSNPGISDIDMVVVTDDDFLITTNFLQSLTKEERYLFTHNLYGISQKHFRQSEFFTFFHNYTLLLGSDLRQQKKPYGENENILKKQIAQEFIVKMYMHIFVQQTYKVLRMRDLLLHVKALQYDFDFLDKKNGRIVELVAKVVEWRKVWFDKTPNEQTIIKWWEEFVTVFEDFAKETLNHNMFYLPDKPLFKTSRNIFLKPYSGELSAHHTGFALPHFLSFTGKKFFNMQNRLNKFKFDVTATHHNMPDTILQKFNFETELRQYGKQFLPHFLPLTSSLHLK